MKTTHYGVARFIAWRYLTSLRTEKSLGAMLIVAWITICISAFCLSLVSAVMQGFEDAMHQKLRGMHADITIHTSSGALAIDAINTVLSKEFPDVVATAPHSLHHALVYTPESSLNLLVAVLQGIIPEQESYVSSITDFLIDTPTKSLPILLTQNNVLIGKGMAESLNVHVGDSLIIAYYPFPLQKGHRHITFDTHTVTIGGIFDTGIDDIDMTLVVAHHACLEQLFEDNHLSYLSIKTKGNADGILLAHKIEQRLDLETYAWQSCYPALIAALRLERYAMFFIFILIASMAMSTISSLIIVLVTYKQTDTAVLYALGMKKSALRSIFIFIGSIITLGASFIGVFMAWICATILTTYKIIQLPDTYCTHHLPAYMTTQTAFIVICIHIIIAIITLIYATRGLQKISVIPLLK